MVLMDNHSDNNDVVPGGLPAKDEGIKDAVSSEGTESDDNNDGSATSRVVDSATSYARECLQKENYTEAAIALRSVLEISKPTSTPFKLAVLHIAQLLKAAQQLDASIDCMLSLYQSMPAPFSIVDGICIIARLYEQRGSVEAALFWRKKHCRPSCWSVFDQNNVKLWEAMADRFFDKDLCVFAADFYAQAMATDPTNDFVPSIRFRYRYLVSLLSFVGPQGPTAHMNVCTSVAWSLAEWFRRRNGSAAHVSACYGDSNFYHLRQLYHASFPAIYRVVFVWVDGPAGRIARWWRRLWTKLHPQPRQSPAAPAPSSVPCTKRKANKKLTKQPAPSTRERQPRSQTRTGLRGKVAAPSPTSPSPSRKPHTSDTIRKKTKAIPRRDISTEPGKKANGIGNRSENLDAKLQVDTPAASNNTPSIDEASTTARRREYVKPRAAMKKSSEFCMQSPTKRRPKDLRLPKSSTQENPTDERPLSAQPTKVSPTDEQCRNRSSSASLLDVYPLQLPRTEDFVAVCGRDPGFADLDLDEVGEFARRAHYRARVLAGKHARVDCLDTAKVKPQWLQDLERAMALVETQQQRNLVSGKVVVEGDSIAHLSEVHTRVVLQITTLCRQYTRDFGESSFTRRLRALTRRLVEWKFTRISEVVAALNEAKTIAMQEEKQRNLEFYHVHNVNKD